LPIEWQLYYILLVYTSKCVVQTDIGCCVAVVFVEQLERFQQSYTQWRFRVYQYLEDVNSERPQTEDAKGLRFNRKMSV